jgi:type I restriction enzyme S subunit
MSDPSNPEPTAETSSISELPKGWAITTLGTLGIWSSGGTPSRKHLEYYGGSIPWVKTGDLQDSYVESTEEFLTDIGLENSSAKLFPAGTLLLAMYGATIGRTGLLKIDAATNQACAALIADELTKDLIPFLWWFLIHKTDEFKSIGQGGAQPNISQTLIKQFPIAIPPFNEQRRIVAKLDRLFAHSRRAREELGRVPGLCDRYKQAILAAAFRGDLTADWRKENLDIEPASELLKQAQKRLKPTKKASQKDKSLENLTTSIAGLPTWIGARLDILLPPGGIFDGPFGSNLKTEDYRDFGVRVIRLENISTLEFINSKESYISHEKYETLKKHTVYGHW